MNSKELVLSLSKAIGIGHQKQVFDIIKSELAPNFEITETQNFILAKIDNKSDYTIMLEAHIDQIGMIVTDISEDGFVSVEPIGSIDPRFLPSTPVKILGKETVFGTFGSVPPHLSGDAECPTFDNLYIDTGRNDVGEIISLGDIAIFDLEPECLLENKVTSMALDNRVGVASVILAGNKLAKSKCPVNIVLLFPLGEELGLRGARVGAYGVTANEALCVDVSFGDCPDVPSRKTAKLGSGVMIGVSPVLNRKICKTLEQTATDKNIPYTLEVMGGNTSTDADVISLTQSGIPTGLLSIPLRNMHTPVEVVGLRDIEATSTLIYEYVLGGGLND